VSPMTEDRAVSDLVAWLTQIWDEQEKACREAQEAIDTYTATAGQGDLELRWMLQLRHGGVFQAGWDMPGPPTPAQDLARIAANRKILAWCAERERIYVGTVGDDPSDPKNYVPGGLKHPADSVVLRLLASAYADRPGFREEWR
jgi:Family of unknown function (DUF6221)